MKKKLILIVVLLCTAAIGLNNWASDARKKRLIYEDKVKKIISAYNLEYAAEINDNEIYFNTERVEWEKLEVNIYFYNEWIENQSFYKNYKKVSIEEFKNYLEDPNTNKDKIDLFIDYCYWHMDPGYEYIKRFDGKFNEMVSKGDPRFTVFGKSYHELSIEEKKSILPELKKEIGKDPIC